MPGKLVLLLEDQPLISLDVEEALADKGIRNVVSLRSQKEALAWLSERSPDFVLLDLFLSDGDSRPVLERLRQCGTPFLIYSGSEKPIDWGNDFFEGVNWVSKPGDPDALAGMIEKRLGGI